MSSLAARREAWISGYMTGPDVHAEERQRSAAALKILRKRADISQEEAAAAAGIHTQSWRNYENAKRAITTPLLAQLTSAIGSSPEEHALEMVKLKAPNEGRAFAAGLAERASSFQLKVGGVVHGGGARPAVFDNGSEPEIIDFARYLESGMRALRMDGMSMFPYAEPGDFIAYNVRRHPRRGTGCVIEMLDGSYNLKRFERYEADGAHLIVSELWPEERELPPIPMTDVKGVYPVELRGG